MQKFEFELFADYFQFYIQDDNESLGDLSDSWTEEATTNLIAVSDGVIGIGTARNMDVPVTIEITDKPVVLLESNYDKINVTSIQCNTGKLVVAGCTDYFQDASRIDIAPGNYEAQVGYKCLNDLSDDGLDGNDSYHVFLSLIDPKYT